MILFLLYPEVKDQSHGFFSCTCVAVLQMTACFARIEIKFWFDNWTKCINSELLKCTSQSSKWRNKPDSVKGYEFLKILYFFFLSHLSGIILSSCLQCNPVYIEFLKLLYFRIKQALSEEVGFHFRKSEATFL